MNNPTQSLQGMQYASTSSNGNAFSESSGLHGVHQNSGAPHGNMAMQLKANLGMGGDNVPALGSHQNSVSNTTTGARAGSIKNNDPRKNFIGNSANGGGLSKQNLAFSNALQQQQMQMRHLMAYNTNIIQGQKLKNAGGMQYQSPSLPHGSKIGNLQAQSAQQLQPLANMQGATHLKNPNGLQNQLSHGGMGVNMGDIHHNSQQVLPGSNLQNQNYINTNVLPATSSNKGFSGSRGEQDLSQRSPHKGRTNVGNLSNVHQNKMNFQNQQKFLNQLNQMNQNTLNNLNQNGRNKNLIPGTKTFNMQQMNQKQAKKVSPMPAMPNEVNQGRNQGRVPQIKATKSQNNKAQAKSRNVQLVQQQIGGTVENLAQGSHQMLRGGNKATQGYLTGGHNQTQQQILDFQNKQLINLHNSSLDGQKGNIQSQTQVFLARSNSQTTAQNPSQLNFQGNRGNQGHKKVSKNLKQRQYDYDLSCYNDTDNTMMKGNEPDTNKKKSSVKQKNNSESVPALSAPANDVQGLKAVNNGSMSQATLQGEFDQIIGGMSDTAATHATAGKASRNKANALNQNTKTLYTNISLKELSQSPDRAQQNGSGLISHNQVKSNKIMIAMGKNNKCQSSNRQQNVEYIQSRRNLQNDSQERINLENQAVMGHTNQEQQRLVNNLSHNQQQARNIHSNNNTYEIQNEAELQQYLNQINSQGNRQIANNQQVVAPVVPMPGRTQVVSQNQTDSIGGHAGQTTANGTSGTNGSILNIKTVQDINIYNNSFIVNTNGGQIPQNLHQQISQQNQFQAPSQNTTNLTSQNATQVSQGSQSQQASQQEVLAKTGGLKLRKDMRAIANGYGQSRSVSQGRNNVISQQSENQSLNSNGAILQTYNGSLTEQHSYGGTAAGIVGDPNVNSRSTKAFEAYNNSGKINIQNNNRGGNVMNHVINQQNIKNLQQNPNQKRIIGNPSGKLFANVGANTGMIKNISGSLGNKQKLGQMPNQIGSQTGYYQNSNPKTLKQGIKGILKEKISSSTSRLQSRTSSRMQQNPSSLEGADQQQMGLLNQMK